ncbi:MAG TPA: thioredoxin-like domain-containing protein [Planctomycetota bacterium]|nr:thioredoxin-like domain-containing protein [Planctomycetota bacterium]
MHIFPDLKKLERKYSKELTVVGVHSAKFPHEGVTENIRKAAQRYELEHPIVNDNKMAIWERYQVNSWPTLILIDPDGKFIGRVSGEGHFDVLEAYIAHTIKVFDEKKKVDRAKVVGKPEKIKPEILHFPAKITAQSATQRLFIADTNGHRILVATPDGQITDVIGSGKLGLKDGSFAEAQFHMPHGIAERGDILYVADCENHVIRKIDLKAKKVETVAGTGKQVWTRQGGPAKTSPLNSPWDVLLSPDGNTLYIAMAGDHRIWSMDIAADTVQILAGNGREAIIDGPFANSSYAQASGLALHNDILYVADSEGSAIRALDLKKKVVETVIGYPNIKASLFTFGDVDGKIGTALLQHALAVLYHEGKLYVADTYNHKIKLIDPVAKTSTTFLGDGKPGLVDGKAPQFYEPGGLALLGDKLYIADTNNHRIRVADLKTKEVKTLELKMPK